MKHKTFSFLLAVLMSMVAGVALAYNAKIDGIYYNFSGTAATVTYYSFNGNKSAYSGSVTIPESVTYSGKSYSVTSIGDRAFYGCSKLTSVTIPESVTSIGDEAFRGCTKLTSVTIPESVTSIGNYAFNSCTGLTAVNIGNGVTSIGDYAFGGCTSLTSVNIGNSVTSIGMGAFRGCSGLTSIEIPNSVTSIGNRAFYDCTGLTSVTIPNSVTEIGSEAFSGCYFAKESLKESFINKSSLSESDNSYWGATLCDEETKDGLLIKNDVAVGCRPWATSVTIPESVTSIGVSAFYGCSGLTSVTIPNSVTSIGDMAFRNCTGLTSVTIGSGVTSIGTSAFEWCSSLTSVTIPNSVTSIGGSAFSGCTSLTSVTIPNSVTSIGGSAFSNCTGLTSVTIPNSVTSIGDMTFYGCKGLTSVTIGNRVTSIGSNAFGGCTGLIELSLGCGLQSIGSKAFADSGIRQLLVKSTTPPTATTNSFSEQTFLRTTLYVPVGTVDDYAYANGWYKFNTIKESAVAEEKVTNEYAYTLMNARTFDYAVYDAVNDRVKMVTISNVDETNPKHCWQTVTMYGRKYLYNIGAKKFAVPGTGEAGLSMSSDVCSISMRTGADGIVLGDNTEQQWALVVDTKMDAYMGLEDVIVTGVLPIDNGQLTMNNANGVYDLSGRKINVNDNLNHNDNLKQLKKGIYIVNGRKVLKR